MKQLFFRLLAAFALGLAASGAIAQDGASADELIQAAKNGLQQIDEERAGEVWDSGAAFLKSRLSRAEFVNNVRMARQTVGTVKQRNWASVVRIRYIDDSSGVPPGLYANVDFSTSLVNDKTVYEKVSLRLEPTGWKLTGYIPREQQ